MMEMLLSRKLVGFAAMDNGAMFDCCWKPVSSDGSSSGVAPYVFVGSGGLVELALRAGRRTNLCRRFEVKRSSRSAMRRQRWTSSTTLVRRAFTVLSSSCSDVLTSSSLAPMAKVYSSISNRAVGLDAQCVP